ncbi:hypothetical protein FMUND_8089 [Fusarium mundagurra]|uniref:PNPLA domain-containing protein n=1 Tax=Fusarium mundagurra TaxID=1567541 RepID=A0A8H6DE09_9HYPO|nr:hypothetical protein FMUND_8089 [Fusarium mundagurra]
MPLQSKRTVKVHEIPAGTSEKEYLDFVEHLCTKPQKPSKSHFSMVTKHFKRKSRVLAGASTSASTDEVGEEAKSEDESELTRPPSNLKGKGEQAAPLLNDSQPTANGWKETTLCLQNGLPVGTISFESETLKNEALARHGKDKKSCWKDWVVEDNFKEVTILYDGPTAKFDICAVHGLGGNAIDTWTADHGKMWLRDLLPEHPNFENSRIMTFGYDSDLTDRSTVMELENWVDTLLRSLNEAMPQLYPTSNYENITLSQCGIVFLATPHRGSTKADWSNFLVATAHTIGGVRPKTVRILQAFNTASVYDTASFFKLIPCPPFQCFAEGLKMRVRGTNQHIVTQASATLGTRQAHMIMDVDHSSICKFESRLGPFTAISKALWELLNNVTTGGLQQPNAGHLRRMFGQPRFLAHAYPPDRGFWWEGNELNGIQHQLTSTKSFFGRSVELTTLESSLAGDRTRPSLTVVKGIGGIGYKSKTELLLQFAATQKDRRNVFFLGSQDGETIDSVLSKLSTRIGFDMIEDPGENQEWWRNTPVAERIQIFFTWLGDTCNKDSLFIIDDIEAFGYSKIPVILRYPARHTLISTRDSNLKRVDRVFRELRLSPLGHDDTVRILQSTLESLSADPAIWNDLGTIARTIQGHPLAARNAIPFAIEYLATYESPSAEFSKLFEIQDPEERRVFLKFSFEGRSLWDAFDTSLERLEQQENPQNATSLLQILPFLSRDNGYVDDFLKMDKRLPLDCEIELPDMAVLKSGYTVMSSWLSKLRGVSFYLQNGSSNHAKALDIHPLMLQYMLLRLDERTRMDLIRQVLQMCHALVDSQNEREAQIKPHVLHCVQVCRGLGILLNSLGLPENTISWVEALHGIQVEEGEDPFRDPIDLSSAAVDEFVKSCVEIILENGVPYFEVATVSQPEIELNQLSSIANECSMAEERLAVFLQAFPSINIEIIGEEIVDRLMNIATQSILPLLSCLTDADIKDWLLPKNHEEYVELESYLFSLFEFLYNVIAILGNEHPLLPLSLPQRILNIAPHGTGNDSMVALQRIAGILKQSKDNGEDLPECKPLSPGTKTDERSHVMLGYFLSLPNMYWPEALTTWQLLLSKSPSQMEYLAAISFCKQSRLVLLERPAFLTLDTMVLEGLLHSRQKHHDQAAKTLEATRVEVVSQYGPCSMQVGIVTAELANCHNILRREALAESILRSTLQARTDSNLSTRRDGVYLRLALADSLIGRARYQEAVPVLESVIDNPGIPATFRMMSALRLARSQRRMLCVPVKAFKQNSPLWTGLTLLGNVPEGLVMEYVEEIGCSISQLPKEQLGESNTTQLIQAVNSALRRSRSLPDSPCLEWYTNLQQEYLARTAKATKVNKGKEKNIDLQTKDKDDIGTPISSKASPRLPIPADVAMSEDEDPWSERLVLSFDGGGVTALSSLLILKSLMKQIRKLEIEHDDGPAFSSGSYPWMDPSTIPTVRYLSDAVEEYLPCHYFDYVAGSSTGGLNAIMLGRLQMSVDQTLNHFEEFCNSVFGHPNAFHNVSTRFLPIPKYSSARARDAFQRIIMGSHVVSNKDSKEKKEFARYEAFTSQDSHTRTMVVSLCSPLDTRMPRIWKSFLSAEIRDGATIWEVALATSANPLYFDAVEISSVVHTTGDLVAINPSFMVLEEVFSQHTKPPTVFVSLGTGSDVDREPRISTRSRYYPNRTDSHTPLHHPRTYDTRAETQRWLSLAEYLGLKQAYRLNVEDNLDGMPDDNWSPARTGRVTIGHITEATEDYLTVNAVKDKIDKIAKEAVRIRRARAKTERWEAFATDIYYICPFCLDRVRFELRAHLREHLQYRHLNRRMSDSEFQAALDQGRRYKGKDAKSV